MADKKRIKTVDRTTGFIDIKGPFSLRDRGSAEKVGKNIMKLAEKYPNATFILRETRRAKSDSVATAAFSKMVTNKLGNRIKIVQADYRGKLKHLGPPEQVREAKIKALKPFETIEFTYGGDVMSENYKMWQDFDKSLSKEVTWDPIRSTPNPNKKSPIRHFVKKYPGFGATKKTDALIDKISEVGKLGRQDLVDAGIQYIRDKSDLFYEQQWKQTRKTGKDPIHSLSKSRLDRLDKLQFKYGTPVVQTGKVNLAEGSELAKTPKPQVPIQTENIGRHTINLPKFEKQKVRSYDLTESKISRHPSGEKFPTVQKTKHERMVETSKTVRVGTEKLAVVKSQGTGKKTEVGIEKRGELGTGYRESGATSTFAPEGYSLQEDSFRDIDEASTIYPKGEGPLHSVKHELEGGVAVPQEDLGDVKKVEHSSRQAWQSKLPPKKTTFKFIKDKTTEGGPAPIRSALTSLDHLQSQEFDDAEAKNKVSYIDEINDTDFESPDVDPADKKGGGNINVDTGEYLDTKEARLAAELENLPQEVENMFAKKSILTRLHKVTNPETGKQEFVPTDTEFKHMDVPKHRVTVRIPLSPLDKTLANVKKKGLENVSGDEIWQTRQGIGPTKALTRNTTMADILYGDAVDMDPDPRHGGQNTTVSATAPDAGDPLTPVNKTKDPTYSLHGRHKARDLSREQQLSEAKAKGDTTKVITKVDEKTGKKYSALILKYAGTGMTIEEQLDKEGALRRQGATGDPGKRTGGRGSKEDLAKKKYVQNRNKQIKTLKKSGDLVYSQRPATDGMSGPEIKITTKRSINKPKQTESNISRLTKGLSKTSKVVIPTGLGIAGWALTPVVAEASLRSKVENPTGKQRLRENLATFLGSNRVLSAVGEKPGYLDHLADYNVSKIREAGKRRVRGTHVTGTVTPYQSMKKWWGESMQTWNAASIKAHEAVKTHGGWRFK